MLLLLPLEKSPSIENIVSQMSFFLMNGLSLPWEVMNSAKNNKSNKKSPYEQVAEALIGYIQTKGAVIVQPQNISHSLSVEMENFMQSQPTKEKIELLENHISVGIKWVQQFRTVDEYEYYSIALQKL
jgi:hypothetical protein